MLQQLLHKNNVVIVILINLCSKKFSKTMSAYTIQLQPICDYLQLLLYCPFRNWKNYLIIFYVSKRNLGLSNYTPDGKIWQELSVLFVVERRVHMLYVMAVIGTIEVVYHVCYIVNTIMDVYKTIHK